MGIGPEDAIDGLPMNVVHFNCTDTNICVSLLPANTRGDTLPPAGSPEYFANVIIPNSLNIWQFHADFVTPDNSTFTGPNTLTVADYQMADWNSVPQKDTTQLLDTLGDRMMMQLQYRNMNGVEALYANHSVILRWREWYTLVRSS